MSDLEREDEVDMAEISSANSQLYAIETEMDCDLREDTANEESARAGVVNLSRVQALNIKQVLRRYVNEELRPRLANLEENSDNGIIHPDDVVDIERDLLNDIDYIEGLAKLLG